MKPDWKDAPQDANYLAMDDDGAWWLFEKRPKTTKFEWYSYSGRAERAERAHHENHWADSLKKRPEEK